MLNPGEHYRLLNIGRNADRSEIKRSYARVLKTTRPDDDPLAFQRLQEAYAFCLAQLGRETDPRDHPAADSHVPLTAGRSAEQSGARLPEEPLATTHELSWTALQLAPRAALDVPGFQEELRQRMDGGKVSHLSRWLYEHEALYSIDLKMALRPAVAEVIARSPRAPTEDHCLPHVMAFFGLDKVDHDGLSEQLQHILADKQRQHAFDRALSRLRSSNKTWRERQIGLELTGPDSPQHRLLVTLVPGLPAQIGAAIHQLAQVAPNLQHPDLNLGNIAFWRQVLDANRLTRPRVVCVLLRTTVWPALFFGVVAAMAAPEDRRNVLLGGSICIAGAAAAWLAYALLRIGLRDINEKLAKHWRISSGTFSSLFCTFICVGVSWLPGLAFAGMAGMTFGYLRPLRGKTERMAALTVASVVVLSICMCICTTTLALELEAGQRFALAFTLASLPLPVWLWMEHSPRLARWSPLLLPVCAVVSLVAAVLV
ncbi:J domain-containing protein [Pseudoxanthomonas composti]|uniref:J domain-containing protein n=1 Tax=Pseudoxanthomonas composti TaxID=2137479 RepID=A0A4Q1JWZ1_9GAMM|nr:J domain-containing protein [Pseudoxanthomonas composti]RXR07146.1 hypothetical protein EPA99_04280 [Pseudoxanthomonas composti]